MEPTDALLEQLRLLNAKPDTPISMFDIGIPLIGFRLHPRRNLECAVISRKQKANNAAAGK